jgi:2-octaprenyl-6-methoxyphenol hydroxylase
MERGPQAERLAALPVAAFEAEMATRSAGLFGPLTLVTRRSVWPIIAQIADRMTGERTALLAEAAHVVPPIGAQGLNMSLADLGCLLDLAARDREALGGRRMLDAYQRRRWPEVWARVHGIDVLNRASMLEPQPLRDLRAGALNALYALGPVRRTLMKAGLGVR